MGARGLWVSWVLRLWLVRGAENVVAASWGSAAGDVSPPPWGFCGLGGKNNKHQHYLLASLTASVMPPTHSS